MSGCDMGTLAKLKMIPCCSGCGSTNMSLAKDSTAYSSCSFDGEVQKWVADGNDTEPSHAEDAIRFYCPECGTPHEVPKELT